MTIQMMPHKCGGGFNITIFNTAVARQINILKILYIVYADQHFRETNLYVKI